jgi:DNA-binding response OmpR family regulator
LLADLADKSFVVRALSLGADDVIARKADAAEIVARVQAVARRRAGLAAPMVETGGLVIDSLGRRVLVGHNEVPLTRLEYELLELLALRHGRIVARDEIMAQLYALNEAPDAKIIGVYVHHIRAKIAALGGNPSVLENVRGRGYALATPGSLDVAA